MSPYYSRSKIVFLAHVLLSTVEHLVSCIPLGVLKYSIYKVKAIKLGVLPIIFHTLTFAEEHQSKRLFSTYTR